MCGELAGRRHVPICLVERERELHLSSHTRLMQVLPGHPLADQEYTIRESELHVGKS